MNTTVTIVLPAWMVWFLIGVVAASLVNSILEIYKRHLEKKLNAAKGKDS